MKFLYFILCFCVSFDVSASDPVDLKGGREEGVFFMASPRTQLKKVGQASSLPNLKRKSSRLEMTHYEIAGKAVVINPLYKVSLPWILKGGPGERKVMNLPTCDPFFQNPHTSHGLNLETIALRCEWRRKYSGDGRDFSNLVGMVRGTLRSLAKAEQEGGHISRVMGKEILIATYRDAIEKSLVTISEATGVPVGMLRSLPPLEIAVEAEQSE